MNQVTETSNEFFDFSKPNNRRAFILLATGALIGLGIAGYGLFTAAGTATNTVPPEYIALVNQRPIYRSDYLLQLQSTFSIPYEEATAAQKHQIAEDMINEELFVQRGLEVDLASYDPDVRNALVSGIELQMYADVLAKQPADDELKAYYKAHESKYASLGVVRMRDLMVNIVEGESAEQTKQRTADAIAALRGGMNLDDAIKKFQLRDSLHLQQGGKADLGDLFDFAVQANLPPKTYAASAKLKAGEISEAITDSDGVHIVVIVSRKEAHPRDFDAVRSNVWSDLKNDEQNKVRTQTINYLRNKSTILRGQE